MRRRNVFPDPNITQALKPFAARNVTMDFPVVDRSREIWRKTIDGWKLLTGKELE